MIWLGKRRKMISCLAVAVFWIQTTYTYQSATVHAIEASVVITNDGPTILGALTTFKAILIFTNETTNKQLDLSTVSTAPSPKNVYQPYIFFWRQEVCGKEKTVEIYQNRTSVISQVYKCAEDLGAHPVELLVKTNTFLFKETVARNVSVIQITEFINANLIIEQGGSCNSSQSHNTCDVVATNKSVAMRVSIHDPSNYFKEASLMYMWMFGDGNEDLTLDQPMINHKYSKSGNYEIIVNITAVFVDDSKNLTNKVSRSGSLNQNLQTMNVVKNLTIAGTSSVDVRATASFNISFYASLPAELCWFVISTTTHMGHPYSLPCNHTTLKSRKWLVVQHQFNSRGIYNVGVRANNTVSSSNYTKAVHVNDTTQPQQVTGLVIGILFGIAACFICFAVINNYMRKQGRRHVEVANFDFVTASINGPNWSEQLKSWHRGKNGETSRLAKNFNRNQVT